ncbi:flagellar basal body rod protein FlgB [Nocardioides bruguierae]|uniref:Flagellar basal body rod protein FlgB n=1 Tax=Nocardioides bruguierae TaxID=2945102 RepID=A0A9X2II93_9ACTN|nr:flagellar basal body rod protein FlgB [Nocardioides bruguierae]MCL8027703.1 flagellar basal body rod protein FlgB [Nocardioides bruguierae]MCM0622570.1 flagellar basal body rod protein FlgB [Nocardioides bruguierae]
MSVPAFAMASPVSAVLGYALDGLSNRQNTIADNLANIDTPGFRATSVDFESVLSGAISGGSTDSLGLRLRGASPITAATQTPVGINGNNVDLRKESLDAMQSQFTYQVVARAVTDRFSLVSTVAAGQ